ncbi:MAG: CHAD domain-containing protein, partial [Cyanobacteria bacterium P01_E01_bin.35]
KLYLNFEEELKHWLKHPLYQSMGKLAIYPLLPDLLLPQVSQFLLHPGWLVGTTIKDGIIQFPQILNQEAIVQLVSTEDYLLHDLRKLAKKTRYNLELFSPLYNNTYNHYLSQIEQIQEILGQIQDFHVLRKILEKALKTAIATQLPTLAELLLSGRYHKWLEWEVIQREFLQEQTRRKLRQTVQHPLKINCK